MTAEDVYTTTKNAHAVKCPICKNDVDVLITIRSIDKFLEEIASGKVTQMFHAKDNVFHSKLSDGKHKVYVFDLRKHRLYR